VLGGCGTKAKEERGWGNEVGLARIRNKNDLFRRQGRQTLSSWEAMRGRLKKKARC